MGTLLVQIVGIALIGTILSLLLRQYKPEYAVLAGLATTLLMLALALHWLEPVLERVRLLFEQTGLPAEDGAIVLRALGICLLAQFAVDLCRDAGENAIASKVELAAKLAVVWTALPLFDRLLSVAVVLIGG